MSSNILKTHDSRSYRDNGSTNFGYKFAAAMSRMSELGLQGVNCPKLSPPPNLRRTDPMPFDQSSTSLANVITKLEALPNLRDTSRRDLISAITRTATYLGCTPADLPTDAPALRSALATIHPAQAGVKPKSLANVKANLAVALRVT